MTVLEKISNEDGQYLVECPGCKMGHIIHTETVNPVGAKWTFDGDMDSPTFSPSLNVKCGELRCHSFIRGGYWEFLSDSTHELSGQKVPMVKIRG